MGNTFLHKDFFSFDKFFFVKDGICANNLFEDSDFPNGYNGKYAKILNITLNCL